VAVPVYTCRIAVGGTTAGVLIVGDPILGKVGTGKVGGGSFMDQGLVDMSARLMGFTTKRGRQDAWSGVTAGTVTALLDDHDGAFDPENAASPYFGNVKIRRKITITATYNSVVYGLGAAYVDGYDAQPLPVDANVQITATDLFKRLQSRDFTVTLPQQTVGARIHALLDILQWPASARIIDAGQMVVPPANLDRYKMLAHVNDLLLAERGLFWVDGNGSAVYRDRAYRQTKVSRGTFGSGGTFPVVKVYPAYNDAGIINEVKCQRTGGVEQVAHDGASIGDYDVVSYRVPQVSADMLPNDSAANALCNYMVGARSQPNNRITKIDLEPEADPTGGLWTHALGADIGDRITVAHSLPGTQGITGQDYFIESVAHSWSLPEGTHLTTWELSLAPTGTWLIVGDAVKGKVGTAVVGF
jgi:hypothetical protein